MEMAQTFARAAAANTLTGALRFAASFLYSVSNFVLEFRFIASSIRTRCIDFDG